MNATSSNGTDGMEEVRHETKLGAIQKNIHQTINSGNPRNLNESVSIIAIRRIYFSTFWKNCEYFVKYNNSFHFFNLTT